MTISKNFYRDLTSAKSEIRNRKAGRTCQIFGIKKNGEPYKRPDQYQGRDVFTKDEAKKLVESWEGLNPGKSWYIMEGNNGTDCGGGAWDRDPDCDCDECRQMEWEANNR